MTRRRRTTEPDPPEGPARRPASDARLHRAVREVYRDDVLWALDKPSGVLSHPNPPARRADNGILRVPYDVKEEVYRSGPGDPPGPPVYLVHRLDQETSGLILCTFSAEAAAALKEALFHHEIRKEYRALVLGIPAAPEGQWTDHLRKESAGGKLVVRAGPGPVNAVTAYSVAKRYPESGLCVLSLRPETGRTHQLRVQAARRGHPIAGDDRYGDFRANRFLAAEIGLKRMFLHALHMELRHPARGHLLRLHAPLPARLADALEKLALVRTPAPRRGE